VEADGDSGSNDTPGRMTFHTTADGSATPTERLRINSAGDVIIDQAGNYATGKFMIYETANTKMGMGITLNQASYDNEILAFKSSDVAHGMTALAEADTFVSIAKHAPTSGGVVLDGFKDADGTANRAANIFGDLGEAADTTDTSSSAGVVSIRGRVTDGGTSVQAVATTGNLFSVDNNATARMLIKGDGTVHASDTSWATALDDLPDAVAGRALVTQRTEETGGGVLAGYNIHAPQLVDVLEERGIVTAAEGPENGHEGHRFLNLQKATKFSWDMGFQNFLFLWHVVKEVMTPEQIDRLPAEFKAGIDLLEAA